VRPRRQPRACAWPAEDTGSFRQDESTLQTPEALVRAGRRAHHVSPGRAAHGGRRRSLCQSA
jgi:hypothetical protein